MSGFFVMHKSKVTAFIIKLKQEYRSGWIPFDARNRLGISNKLYGKLFHHAIELKLLRKGKRGYFIRSFTLQLHILFGHGSTHIRIPNIDESYQKTVQWTLMSLINHKVSKQYASARKTILKKEGKDTDQWINPKELSGKLREGVLANVRISSRQIGKAIGVSFVKANQLINKMKADGLLTIIKPKYMKRKRKRSKKKKPTSLGYKMYVHRKKNNMWLAERLVVEIHEFKKDRLNDYLPFLNPSIM